MNTIYKLQISIQRLSFTIAFCVLLQQLVAQISDGHVDDFQNLTTSGWMEGAVSPNPPMVISSGGPAGDDDAYLRNISSGTMGAAGGKWVMFNQSSNWLGNYISAGVVRITMDVRNSGATSVHLRIAFNGNGGAIASDTSFTLLAGSAWQSLEFDVDPMAFVPLGVGGDATSTLSSVNEFRILSNTQATNVGAEIAATIDIDNIRATGISAVRDRNISQWNVFPNPVTDRLQLRRSRLPAGRQGYDQPVSITMTNILGQVLVHQTLLPPYHLNVPAQAPGLYYLLIDGVSSIPLIFAE
jgi:hypothetical protein